MNPEVKKVLRRHLYVVGVIAVFNLGMGIAGQLKSDAENLILGLVIYLGVVAFDLLYIIISLIGAGITDKEGRANALRQAGVYSLSLLMVTLIYFPSCFGGAFISQQVLK